MARRRNLIQELWAFLRVRKAYWMIPILIVLLLFALLIIFGGTGAAPFIYTLF